MQTPDIYFVGDECFTFCFLNRDIHREPAQSEKAESGLI